MRVIVIVIVIWWSPFIPSRNLDEVFTYNQMALMSLRSFVMAITFLTKADHLFINNYIRSLLNTIVRPILMVGQLNPCPTACVYDAVAN